MMTGTETIGTRSLAPGRLVRIATALRDTGRGYRAWLEVERDSAKHDFTKPADPRHVLIVAPSLPPRSGSGVFRPTAWLTYAPDNGWRVTALTRALDEAPDEAGRALAATIPPDVRIVEAPALGLAPSHKLYARLDGGLLSALALYRAGVARVAGDPPAVVVATGPSFNMFVAGFYLARRFGAKLVLDYRDEWTENPFPATVKAGRFDRWWEPRCLSAADGVVFTTESQLRNTNAVFGGRIDGKGAIVPNGWDPKAATAAPLPREPDTFEIVFSGLLDRHTLPAAFLADCAAVLARQPALAERLRLRFIGRRHPAADAELSRFAVPDALILDGLQPKATADATIRRSDVLLLMLKPHMARYMSAKLFEYLATDRPILVHGCAGEMADLVTRLGAGMHVKEGDADGLARAFATLSATPARTWDTARRREWAAAHTRERLAARFYGVLAQVVAGQPVAGETVAGETA